MKMKSITIKGVLEVLFLLILLLTTFFTMPFLLEAVERDIMVGVNYLCLIVVMIYILKKKTTEKKQ